MRNERGFSLLIVLFLLIIMAVVGITAASLGWSDSSTADARSARAQALLAAETGMGILTVSGDAATIETLVDAKDETYTELQAIDLDGDAALEHRPGFLVKKGLNGYFIVEGQLRDESNRIVARARLAGRATSFVGGDAYEGQIGMNPRGTGVVDERDVNAREAQSPL